MMMMMMMMMIDVTLEKPSELGHAKVTFGQNTDLSH
jgi:hypothetical protein